MSTFFPIHDGDDDYFSHSHHPDEVDTLLSPFLEPRRKPSSRIIPRSSSRNFLLGKCLPSLPDELLAEIFTWCCPSICNQDTSLAFAALLLSQVSSRWRRIAHSTPRLWTYTRLIVRERDLHPALSLLRLWISHAGALGVAIDVEFHERWQYPNSTPLLELFKQCARTVLQTRPDRISASCEPSPETDIISHVWGGEADDGYSWLEEWNFWSSHGYSSLRNGASHSSSSHSSTSEWIEIRSSYRTSNFFVPNKYLSYANTLTYLCLEDNPDWQFLSSESVLRILETFPRLVRLEAHLCRQEPHELVFPRDRFTASNLASFSLSFADGLDVGPLLDALVMPSLKELELSGYLDDDIQSWPHLRNFLRASVQASQDANPGLSHLRLVGLDCFYIHFLDCIQYCFDTLKELELDDCILSGDILASLLTSAHRPHRLKSLNLLTCFDISLSSVTEVLNVVATAFRDLQVYVNNCKPCSRQEREVAERNPNLFLGPQYYVLKDE